MPVDVKLNYCKCGRLEKILNTNKGSWIYCSASRWYNFWKHRPKEQIAWY